MLHPAVGRFVQRDPLDQNQPGGGYHDGMNVYAAYGALRGGMDPSGLQYLPLPGASPKETMGFYSPEDHVPPTPGFEVTELRFRPSATLVPRTNADSVLDIPRKWKTWNGLRHWLEIRLDEHWDNKDNIGDCDSWDDYRPFGVPRRETRIQVKRVFRTKMSPPIRQDPHIFERGEGNEVYEVYSEEQKRVLECTCHRVDGNTEFYWHAEEPPGGGDENILLGYLVKEFELFWRRGAPRIWARGIDSTQHVTPHLPGAT